LKVENKMREEAEQIRLKRRRVSERKVRKFNIFNCKAAYVEIQAQTNTSKYNGKNYLKSPQIIHFRNFARSFCYLEIEMSMKTF
jgi:hypothetical protein